MTSIPLAVRRSYAAAGWRLWRKDGYLAGEPACVYYAVTARGRAPGVAETLWSGTPAGVLREVLAHPSMRPS